MKRLLVIALVLALAVLPCLAEADATPGEGRMTFAELTGLDEFRERLDAGTAILSAYYTDGYGFSTSEFTTDDPDEIEALLAALGEMEVVGRVNEDITDWYPQIVFRLSDDTCFRVCFDAHWLEIGGMDHYELEKDEGFWSLTAELVGRYGGDD